jgi:hypothetical protein
MKYAKAIKAPTLSASLYGGGWDNIRVAASQSRIDRNLSDQASKILKETFDPSKYLLSHCTIVASVDTVEVPSSRLGSSMVDGKKVVRKTTAYRITPSTECYVNNNFDSWARPVLLKSYKTFTGAFNFLEHVQIEDLSKGRILDAVARDIGDSVYVDILIATDRKHTELIKDIESGELSTLSMGCFLPGTQVSLADGTRVAIEDVQVGDMVLTHKGRSREVLNKQIRGGKWGVRRIEAVGVPSAITATDIHPFFVFRLPDVCACGCGESLPASYSSGKRTALPNRLSRRFKDGHNLRILNPNGTYSLEERAARQARLNDLLSPRMEEVKAADLKVGDFLCFPRAQFGSGVDTTSGRARLLGYFLAEGNFQKRDGKHHTVEFNFSLHERDTYAAEVMRLLTEEFPGCNPRLYTAGESEGCAATVVVAGSDIAAWFLKHGGEYSHGKRLHPDVMAWSVENQLHLLGAWVNGDGNLQKGGATSVTTVSYDLVCQMHAIMARCGIYARMYGLVQGKSVDVAEVVNGGLVQTLCDDGSYRRPSFQLDLGQTQSQALRGRCDKVRLDPKFQTQACRVQDDVVMFPITSIEAQTYEGWVHDMEVEEDHSYVVEGVAVHNCSIDGSTCTKCGHWAADETEFCFPPGTRVLKSDGKYVAIEEIVSGDVVLTHKGNHRRVLNTMSRHYDGHVSVLTVDGVPNPVRATVNHPFWVLRPRQDCACGCGQLLRRTVEHERGASQSFQRRFLPGHNSRVWNHNKSENILTLEDYTRLFDLDMEFVPAKELRKGDYLTFPIPQEVHNTEDATERRARLIGYFLSEGSYIKRDGERVGVEFTFGHHETNTLAAEVLDLLNAEWGQATRRGTGAGWKEISAKSGVKPIRRRVNSRPVPSDVSCPDCGAPSEYAGNASFNPKRDDCYACKVCGMQWLQNADRSVQARLYPPSVEGQGSCSVRLMLKETADWFYRYCGEYSDGKQLHPDVMRWEPEVQKHILFGWMNGDGTQSHTGITGCTASFHLMSQMHVLAARCGWYGRKQVVFGDRVTEVNQVVNGDGSVTARDHRGWLPQFRMVLSEPSGFGQEVKFTEPEKARVTLSSFTDGFKRVGNWLLYRVRDTSVECYSGTVHNFEVEEDNSYVVEGLAVHNCDHVKYMKGNTFYDEKGVKHRIAELCGDVTLDPTGGVQFIEASWVKVPAFKGAVARNLITLSRGDKGKTAQRIQNVLDTPAPRVPADGYLKAARQVLADDLGEGDGSEEAPADPSVPAATPDPLKGITDELKQYVLDNLKKSLKEDLSKSDLTKALLPPEDSSQPNDTIVKQARAKRAHYLSGVRGILRTAGTDQEAVLKIARLNRKYAILIPEVLYRTILKVGGSHKYGSLPAFLDGCRNSLGRPPTLGEARTLIRLAKLLTTRSVGVTPKKP